MNNEFITLYDDFYNFVYFHEQCKTLEKAFISLFTFFLILSSLTSSASVSLYYNFIDIFYHFANCQTFDDFDNPEHS